MIRAMMFLQKLSSRIVDILSFGILLFLFVVSLVQTCTIVTDGFENSLYYSDSVFVNGMGIFVILTIIYLLYKFWGKEKKKALYTVTAVLYGAISVYTVHSLYPVSDQLDCLTAAGNLLAGDYSDWAYGGYCYRFTNQNGLVLYFAVMFTVFGVNNYLAVYGANILFYFVSVCLIRKMISFYTEEKALLYVAWTMMLLYYPAICYTGFAYGIIPGFFFLTLAVWFYFLYSRSEDGRKSILYMLLAGLSLFLAICLKSNYMISAIAVILVCIVRAVSEKSARQAMVLAVFVIAFAAAVRLPNLFFEKLTGNPTDEGIPAVAWIEMGLQKTELTSAGWFDLYNYNIYATAGGSHDLAQELAIADLKETWLDFKNDPASLLDFLYEKITTQWNNVDFQSHEVLLYRSDKEDLLSWFTDDGSRFHSAYLWVLDRIMSAVYFGCLCYLMFRRKEPDIVLRIGYIIFLGGFLFHIFWEGKSQYVLPYFVLLIPFAVCGLWGLMGQIAELFQTIRRSGKFFWNRNKH
jgi:hypothetical protein